MGASFVLTGCGGGDNGASSSLTDNRFVEEKNKLESSFKEIKNKEIALQYDLDQAKQDASREGDQLQKELDKVEAFKEANSSAKQYFDEVRKLEKVQIEIGAALDQGKELISKFQTSVNVVNINNNLTLVNNQSATLQVNVEAAQLSVKNAMGVLQKNFVMLLPMDQQESLLKRLSEQYKRVREVTKIQKEIALLRSEEQMLAIKDHDYTVFDILYNFGPKTLSGDLSLDEVKYFFDAVDSREDNELVAPANRFISYLKSEMSTLEKTRNVFLKFINAPLFDGMIEYVADSFQSLANETIEKYDFSINFLKNQSNPWFVILGSPLKIKVGSEGYELRVEIGDILKSIGDKLVGYASNFHEFVDKVVSKETIPEVKFVKGKPEVLKQGVQDSVLPKFKAITKSLF